MPASVEFNIGETENSFIFSATADTLDDDDESVKLAFGTLPTDVSEGIIKDAVIAITDDDVPSVSVSYGSATYGVVESDDPNTADASENEVEVTVTLSADPERTVIIPITTTDQGGATAADYSGIPTSVTFNSGETEKSFTFSATADAVDDDGESVRLTFGEMPTGVSAGTTTETTVSILDDDVPDVTVRFGAVAYSVAESDDTNTAAVTENEVEVTVTLSADPERTVTIPLTITEQGGATGRRLLRSASQRYFQQR